MKETSGQRKKRALRTTMQHRQEALFLQSPIGMAVTTLDGQIGRLNPALCLLLDATIGEFIGASFADIAHADHASVIRRLDARLKAGEMPNYELETQLRRKDGEQVHVWLKVALIHGSDGAPRQLFVHVVNITRRKEMEERLRHEAGHDSVTGLPNRTTFAARLHHAHQTATPHGVLFIDLDQFQMVNDSLGHQTGDLLLVEVAQRFRTAVAGRHLVTRHGGDEFVVLLLDVTNADDALKVVHQLHDALLAPFELRGQNVYMSASIGVALSHDLVQEPGALLREADTALSRAKGLGRGSVALFDNEMHTAVVERLRLETEMRRGIESEEFETFYQPVVNLSDGRIAGFEALLRWRHPTRGMLTPSAFLEVAEDTGHIVALGRQVVEDTCRLIPNLQRGPGECDVFVTVNLGSKEFAHPALTDSLDSALQRTAVDPRCLRLEITETVLMAYERNDFELLERLKRLGLRLYIDDFGTGHSSLAHLHRLPIDAVKIDREFVRRCGPQGEHLEIVVAVVSIARAFGIQVVAEGIESELQLSHMRRLGCQYGQGWLFGRPMDAEAAVELTSAGPRW